MTGAEFRIVTLLLVTVDPSSVPSFGVTVHETESPLENAPDKALDVYYTAFPFTYHA